MACKACYSLIKGKNVFIWKNNAKRKTWTFDIGVNNHTHKLPIKVWPDGKNIKKENADKRMQGGKFGQSDTPQAWRHYVCIIQ